jgi:DNA-binding transcriptional ArsR family regulator
MVLGREDRRFIREGAARAAAMLRAVGNEHRMLVLCLLIDQGEMTVGELLQHVPLSQSALSQHLAKMREEGLVTFRREAQALYYRIDDPKVEQLMATLKAMFCPGR